MSMKAALFYGAGDIRVEDVPIPDLRPDQVQVQVAWCGICGSDLHEYTSGPIFTPGAEAHPLTGARTPVILGHEFSGIITKVGADAGEWALGDRVVVEPVISCKKCYSCTNARSNVCDKIGFIGLSGWGGGLAEYINVNAHDGFLHLLPDNVSLEDGAMVEPLAVAMHAVQASKLVVGGTALVVGAGPIGCFIVKTLLGQGASKVIVSEPSAMRRAMATRAGAHHVFNPMEDDVVLECHNLTGGADVGVNVSFECAGVQKALDQALGSLMTRGTCVNVAVWDVEARIDMVALILKEKTLTGVICYQDNHKSALESLSSGSISLDGFVTARIPIERLVTDGLEELLNHNERHVKILVSPTPQFLEGESRGEVPVPRSLRAVL